MNCRPYSTPPRRTWGWLKSGLFGAALALFGTAQAQIDVQIGTGTSTTSYMPLYTCYGYNYSQQIYTAAEIAAAGGGAGTINKIRFYYDASGTTYTNWNSWTVYLGNTTQETLVGTTGWIPVGSMTQVFSGTIPTPVAGTWLELTLTTPFAYDGTNLVVAVDENSPSWSCTATWRSFTATAAPSGEYRALLYYSDGTNPDPASPPTASSFSGTSSTVRSQVQLEITLPPCVSADGGTVAPLTSACDGDTRTMTSTGAAGGSGISYQWEVSPTGGGVGFVDVSGGTGATTTSYTTDALTVGTNYYRLRVECTNGPLTGYSNEVELTVNPLPTVSVTPATADYCANTTAVNLTASGAANYTWAPATGLDAATGSSVNASPTSSTTYTVTGTDGEGCQSTATAAINVLGTAPIISSATADPNPTCFNGNSQLNAVTNIPAPVNLYSFSSTMGTFTSIVGQPGTVVIASGVDDTGYGPYPLGFTFNFNGNDYTSAGVNANGYVAMGALATSTYTSLSSGALNNVIAALNGDLRGLATGNQICYQLSGSPGSQVFTFEWANWGFYSGGLDEVSFQVKLYEGTNVVQTVYRNGTATNSRNCQVGLRGSSSAVFNNRTTATDWTATTAGAANTDYCLINATVRPVTGLTFTWTPPTATYLWTPNTFLDFDNIANPMASSVNVASQTYTVTATNGVCSNSAEVTLNTSDPITTASISGNLAYCTGGSTTLTAVPGDGGAPFTYLWSPGGETTASIEASAVGLYSCQVTDNCGGSVNTGDVSVTENSLPVVSVDPTTATSCDGAPVELNASGADTYSWEPATGLDVTNAATVNASPAAGTTYTVTGTDANGCSNTATATVNVGAAPVINSTTATPPEACPGTDVQLAVSVGSTPSYCNSNFTSVSYEFISAVAFQEINNTSAGNTGGPVNYTAQVANVTAGMSYDLHVTIDPDANDYVYAWFDWNQNGVLNDPGEQFTVVTATSLPGPHTINIPVPASAYNGNTRMRVMVDWNNATPNPCRSATYGEAEDYTVNVSGGVDLYIYSWDPATGLSDATISNPVAEDVLVDATYTVSVSDAYGCTSTDDVSFTMLEAPPAPDVTPASATICPGGELQLSAEVNDGSEPVPYCNSNFTSVSFEFLTNVTFQEINNTSAGNTGGPVDYTAQVANVTAGMSYDLTVTMDPDANDYIYAWFDWNQNGVLNDAGEAFTVITASDQAGPHTVSIPVPAGAYNGNTRMRVMVDWNNATPNPCRSATYGEAEDYTVNVSGGVEPPAPPVYTWNWSPADFLNDATIANPMIEDFGATTTYTVTATNEDGCASAGTEVTITADPLLLPPAPTAAADPGIVCPGSTTQLSSSVGSGASYCNSNFTSVTYEHITNVTYADINNSSAGNTGGPVDYTAQVANVTVGVANDLSVTILVDGSENVTAWIDWNQNGTLNDAGEEYILASLTSSPGPFTVSVTPPPGAHNGNTRMRVQLSYSTANAPCLSSYYGESEDYTVNVSGGVAACTAGYTFSWSPAAGLDDANTCNPVATVTEFTTYTVTATNTMGCSSSSTVDVDVETLDGDADGTPDCADGCPTDPAKADPGQCGCFNPDTDTDADGTADCVDGCPTDPNKIEAGICGCNVSDVDSDSDGTADCLDLCPSDPTKIVPGACGCGVPDTDDDADGIADCNDSCPGVFGQVGSPCDDGNETSINDVLTETCECLGTPIVCEENGVLLDLVMDDNGSETSWDIVTQGTNDVMCSGNSYLPNQVITMACCLVDGCYELRVFDSAGDGMASGTTGGYVLRTDDDQRIIDNNGDGIFTSVSQVSGNLGFCLPIGTDAVIPSNCDKDDWKVEDIIQAQINPAVTAQFGLTNATSGYQFWFFNPDGGYNRRITQTHAAPGTVTGVSANQRAAFLRLSNIVTYPLPAYTNLNVRIRTEVAGVFSEWGPACRFALNPPCATTQLTTLAAPVVSCGATGLAFGNRIYAETVPGANLYQFEFTKPGYLRRLAVADRSTLLNFVTFPLTNNTCYHVRVRVSFDGGNTYCPFGPSCTITLGSAICGEAMPPAPDDAADFSADEQLTIWPNPNDGSLVNLSLTGLASDVNTVGVDVTDAFGRLVATRTLPVQGGLVRSTMSFEETLAPGLYLVNMQVGDHRWTERLVIQ